LRRGDQALLRVVLLERQQGNLLLPELLVLCKQGSGAHYAGARVSLFVA
jgi:hypothetical protein